MSCTPLKQFLKHLPARSQKKLLSEKKTNETNLALHILGGGFLRLLFG